MSCPCIYIYCSCQHEGLLSVQIVWEPGVGAWSASLWKLWWHQGDWVARTGSKYPLAPRGPSEWNVGVLYHLSPSSVDASGHGKRPPEVPAGLLFTDKGTYSLPQVWEGQLPSASLNRGCQNRYSHPALPLNVMSRPAGCPYPPSQPFPWATCRLKHLGSPFIF